MESLPVVPAACTLDQSSLEAQLARYRALGAQAIALERTPRRLEIRLADRARDDEIAELIAVERACCPFFAMDWRAHERVLAISVASSNEEPALDSIAFALGLD